MMEENQRMRWGFLSSAHTLVQCFPLLSPPLIIILDPSSDLGSFTGAWFPFSHCLCSGSASTMGDYGRLWA